MAYGLELAGLRRKFWTGSKGGLTREKCPPTVPGEGGERGCPDLRSFPTEASP